MTSLEQRWEERWTSRGSGPTQLLRVQESTELGHPADMVWALLTCVEQAPVLSPATVQRAFVVPGTPDGVGQQQCCVAPDGSVSILELTEADAPRRGAARQIAPPSPLPLRSTYDLAPEPRRRLRGRRPRPRALRRSPRCSRPPHQRRTQPGPAVADPRVRPADRRRPPRVEVGADRAGRLRSRPRRGATQLEGPGATASLTGDGPTRVPRPADAQDVRLLPPVAPPAGGGGYDLLQQHLGRPVGFDPCQPVHWVMRRDGAPADAIPPLSEAFARLSEATGLVFVHDGLTDETYDEQPPLVQPDRYGERYAPVLVAWSSEAETEGLAGPVGGFAGPVGLDPDGAGPRYLTGQMVLDAPQLAELQQGWPARLGVVLHELGHLAGLGHVDDPADTMHESTGPTTTYSPGALRGLAAVGSGPCFLDSAQSPRS